MTWKEINGIHYSKPTNNKVPCRIYALSDGMLGWKIKLERLNTKTSHGRGWVEIEDVAIKPDLDTMEQQLKEAIETLQQVADWLFFGVETFKVG